ncbi:hypothetical protein K5V21_13665 [Clostridium sardiniense]|uniref:Uncharacterized protein n=1 Tax=Clostridium sardiniense TaxID=29369 RepID=A0ABS7L0A5_CLOSR|nr:hypothetical protein [Clostridium sardiniense]MBY0756494.1 hypothetical protein [Clostridium sardiniense]MDQ0460237.1 hypothetical protein [Clostridium sardiniense]
MLLRTIINKEKEIRKLSIELNNKRTLNDQIDSTVKRMNDNERKLIEFKYTNRNIYFGIKQNPFYDLM